MRRLRFECLKCAHCCKNLLKTVRLKGNTFQQGLHLFPEEVNRLRELAARFGSGCRILPKWRGASTEEVITYQLVSEPCPFLEDTNCLIYSRRPLSCRLFPRTSWGRLDPSCTWVKNHELDRREGEIVVVSDQLNKAFHKITSKLYKRITDLSEKEVILYDFKGEQKAQVGVEAFLKAFERERAKEESLKARNGSS